MINSARLLFYRVYRQNRWCKVRFVGGSGIVDGVGGALQREGCRETIAYNRLLMY